MGARFGRFTSLIEVWLLCPEDLVPSLCEILRWAIIVILPELLMLIMILLPEWHFSPSPFLDYFLVLARWLRHGIGSPAACLPQASHEHRRLLFALLLARLPPSLAGCLRWLFGVVEVDGVGAEADCLAFIACPSRKVLCLQSELLTG